MRHSQWWLRPFFLCWGEWLKSHCCYWARMVLFFTWHQAYAVVLQVIGTAARLLSDFIWRKRVPCSLIPSERSSVPLQIYNPHWHLKVFLSWRDRFPGKYWMLVWQSGSKLCSSHGLYAADAVNISFLLLDLFSAVLHEVRRSYHAWDLKDTVFLWRCSCSALFIWNRCAWSQRRNKVDYSREEAPGSSSGKL